MADYADGPWAGTPAVTTYAHGRGSVTYVGTTLSEPLAGQLLDQTLQQASVDTCPSEAMVEVVERTNDSYRYLIVLNHRGSPANHNAPENGFDLLSAARVLRIDRAAAVRRKRDPPAQVPQQAVEALRAGPDHSA